MVRRYVVRLLLFITILLISLSLVLVSSTNSFSNLFVFINGQEFSNAQIASIKSAVLPQIVEQSNDTALQLKLSRVVKNINGSNATMYGLNGQVPGPILKVKQGSSIFVNLTNNIDMETSIHWHGLKLNNTYDGVPGLTQASLKPGQSFIYKLDFPNEGVYWYHSHFREEKQQDLGVYGVILVEPKSKDYYNPVDVEVPLTLDDILMANGSIYPYNNDQETFALMGRYGNIPLLNGQTDYELNVNESQVARFFLVDTANARPYNFTIEGHKLKLVGGDSGKYEKESLANSVILSPAERQIIEVLFDKPGKFKILNVTPERVYQLGTIAVSEQQSSFPQSTTAGVNSNSFYALKENHDIISQVQPYKKYFLQKPDYVINLTVELGSITNMPYMAQMSSEMEGEKPKQYINNNNNIEWDVSKDKFDMNADSTPDIVRWILKNNATGKENQDNILEIKNGEVKKIRLYNDPNSVHPMQHPMHIHGLHFLVSSQDGKENNNLGWKDTVLVPTGSTVDILLVADNPGLWELHCHIPEHRGAGMKSLIKVV